MKLRVYILLLFLSFLGYVLPSKAQVITRRLSYTQLFEEIQNTKDSVYKLENAEIYYEHKTDSLRFNYWNRHSYGFDVLPIINVEKYIILKDVILKNDFRVRRVHFKHKLTLSSQSLAPQTNQCTYIEFEECTFNKMPDISYPENMKIDVWRHCFSFTKCVFLEKEQEVPSLARNFEDCIFHERVTVTLIPEKNPTINFTSCTFYKNLNVWSSYQKKGQSIRFHDCYFYGFSLGLDIDYVNITDSFFCSSKSHDTQNTIFDTNCQRFLILNSHIESPFKIIGSKINSLVLQNNIFENHFASGIGVSRNIIDWTNSYLPYNQFKKGLSIIESQNGEYNNTLRIDLKNNEEYKNLLELYGVFYKVYSDKKDQESANACYIALKDLETRKLAYDYKYKDHSFKAYLTWKLNVFLEYFCDYGTDPVKALEKSVYWILIFTLLYVIFPSEKDYLHKSLLMPKLQKWANYLKHEGGFAEIEDKKRQEKIEALERFKTELKNTEGKIPMVLSIFSKPLYSSAMLYYKLQKWLIHKIDFTQGNWVELSKKRKFIVSIGMFSYLLVFVFWGITMRILNALALSINCFVTLGYGEISAKGIARYLAVLEGLFGWFLLSIFSVSLIGQILG